MKNNTHKRKATSSKAANQNNTLADSTSTEAQRKRLIDWLRTYGQIDTLTARRELDILGVAQRIIELRKRYRIDTVWTKQPTDCGALHRVGLYVLIGEVCDE